MKKNFRLHLLAAQSALIFGGLLLHMDTQRKELLSQLPEYGWRVARIEENLEWWADEMWLLESLWSPVGSYAYVTFLVDPMFAGYRRKGQAVWAVMASPAKPISRIEVEGAFRMSLGRGWKNCLPAFFEYLTALRSQIRESHQT